MSFIWRKDTNEAQAYWESLLKDSALPDFPSQKISSTQSARRNVAISMSSLSRDYECLPSSLLLACWTKIYALHCNSDDILFGMVLSGRDIALDGVKDIIGPCISTIPFRIKIEKSWTNKDLAKAIQDINGKCVDMGFIGLKNALKAACIRHDALKSIVNIMMDDQAVNNNSPFKIDANSSEMDTDVPLVVDIRICKSKVELEVILNGGDDHYADLIASQFEALLLGLKKSMNDPCRPFNVICKILDSKINESLVLMKLPAEVTLHGCFEQVAMSNPTATAIVYQGRDFYTYQTINNMSNMLAEMLFDKGIRSGDIIPICFDKGVEAVVSIIALMKIGAIYVPLNPKSPTTRNDLIVSRTKAKFVLTIDSLVKLFKSISVIPIYLDNLVGEGNPPISSTRGSDLAYIMFTSGSTGEPKGVMMEHSSIVHSIKAHSKMTNFSQLNSMLQFSNFTFDVSVADMFIPLLNGGVLHIYSDEVLHGDLNYALSSSKATHLILTPTMAKLLDVNNIPHLRSLIVGGEILPKQLIMSLYDKCQLINCYGPTEAAVSCIAKEVTSSSVEGKNIGSAIGNNVAFVLDDDLNLVGIGGVGELVVCGPQLARGYYLDQEKTNAAFLDYIPCLQRRGYKTGDLVKLLPNGEFEILGRKDRQMKFHGIRIEAEEIEYQIMQASDFHKSVIFVQLKDDKEHLVCAFVPPVATRHDSCHVLSLQTPSLKEKVLLCRDRIVKKLPKYMVPTDWMPLSSLPWTPNGKIDLNELQRLMNDSMQNFNLQYILLM